MNSALCVCWPSAMRPSGTWGASDRGLPVTESHERPLGRAREAILWDGTDVERSWCTGSTGSPTEWGRSITQKVLLASKVFVLEIQNELC